MRTEGSQEIITTTTHPCSFSVVRVIEVFDGEVEKLSINVSLAIPAETRAIIDAWMPIIANVWWTMLLPQRHALVVQNVSGVPQGLCVCELVSSIPLLTLLLHLKLILLLINRYAFVNRLRSALA
jgi:hypothetical protein